MKDNYEFGSFVTQETNWMHAEDNASGARDDCHM